MSSNATTEGGDQTATVANPAHADGSSPKKRKLGLILGGVLLLAALGWGAYWLLVGRFIQSTDDAYLQADVVTVAPKITGYVAEVYVVDNQIVKKGDPLVRLDSRQYQAQLEQAEATAEARRADAVRAEAVVKVDELDLAHAREEYNRYKPLEATGAATAEKLADLRNTLDRATSTLAADRAQLDQLRAQIKAGEASVKQSGLDVSDTIVRSAIDGRVGDFAARLGQFAQPGTRLMSIVPVQDVYLVANFKETQIGRMRVGQPATLNVDALSGNGIHGVVDSFAPGTGAQFALLPPENATGNFTKIVQRVPVRIRIEADDKTKALLLPGLSVTVDVDTRK